MDGLLTSVAFGRQRMEPWPLRGTIVGVRTCPSACVSRSRFGAVGSVSDRRKSLRVLAGVRAGGSGCAGLARSRLDFGRVAVGEATVLSADACQLRSARESLEAERVLVFQESRPEADQRSATRRLRPWRRRVGGWWVCSLSSSGRFGGVNSSRKLRFPGGGAADRSERRRILPRAGGVGGSGSEGATAGRYGDTL